MQKDTRMNNWIKHLLINLDENLDEATKISIMESCGEECPFTHLNDERLMEPKFDSFHSFMKRISSL